MNIHHINNEILDTFITTDTFFKLSFSATAEISKCESLVMLPFLIILDLVFLSLYKSRCKEPEMFTLYPWIHQFCNNVTFSDQVRPITFPDISPSDVPKDVQFSMAAGDFLEVYTEPGRNFLVLGNYFF